ncbi:acyl-CoA N-acyltransferase [Astrocystis sublimbata]|nr:acyl-CoA N-acyltransferase [Astrocystis sublimbata]
MTSTEPPSSLVTIKTTLPKRPFPPNASRAPLRTARLILRPCTQDDLAALHALRTQPEVMACTAAGTIDASLAVTQGRLDPFLPPGDGETYNPAICLAATGELIGLGGVFNLAKCEFGWPEVGYMLRKEHWGKGYATEFITAFLEAWWGLEREVVQIRVDSSSVRGGEVKDGDTVPEMLGAIVEAGNRGSLRIMEKGGFTRFKSWTEASQHKGEEGSEVTLVGFVNTGPAK